MRHPRELAKRGPIRFDTPAFAQNTKYSYRKTWFPGQRRGSVFLHSAAGGGGPGRTIRSPAANNPFARGEQSGGSGRTIRPQDCGKRAPRPTIYSIYRAQEVYPLSPLLRGGFQRRGGVPYQHESKFLIVFTNEPSGVSEGNCTTRILLV